MRAITATARSQLVRTPKSIHQDDEADDSDEQVPDQRTRERRSTTWAIPFIP